MFVRNAWYIGALSAEVAPGGLLGRTILGEPVVFARLADGRVTALADRCPHRYAPLSLGSVSGQAIRCGYHGMAFGADGVCTANPVSPASGAVGKARVPSYPLVERDGFLWIWPGDPATADPAAIPDYGKYRDPAWTAATHYMHVDANYLLLIDNLMDLSHIAFVHGDILGNDDVVDQERSETIAGETTVSECRLIVNGAPIPVWRDVLGEVGKVDLWMDIHWSMASNIILDVGSTPTGQPRAAGAGIWNLDCVTPETATTSHYFYGHARQYARDDAAMTRFWDEAMAYAFTQDKVMVEAVQRRMGSAWNLLAMNPPPVINGTDRAAILVRRKLLQAMRREEQAGG